MRTGNLTTALLLIYIAISLVFSGCSGHGEQVPASQLSGATSIATENNALTFQLPGYFYGFNAQMLRGPSWHAEGFVTQVRELRPGMIRYPGGTVASYWDWRTGWLKKDIPLRSGWKNIPENPIKLEDLKFACDQTGAIPLFVLNTMTSTLEEQLNMLNQAKKIGLPVGFVELDNEIYLGEEFYVKQFPTGIEYGQMANTWISSLKKQFGGVKVAVVGNAMREGQAKKEKPNAQRRQNWNRDVLSVIKDADAMTFHVYGGSGLKYLGNLSAGSDDDEGEPAKMQQAFEKPEAVPYILSMPFHAWNHSNTYDYKLLPPGMKAWITEYNLFEMEGVVAGTWVHGLYALMQTLLFLENQQTGLICYHNLTTSAQFAALFNDEDGFFKSVKKKPTTKFGFTASGQCLSFFGKAIASGHFKTGEKLIPANAGKAVKLNFSNNEMQNAPRGKQYTTVNGWKINNSTGTKIIVTNLGSTAITVDFSKVITEPVNFSQMHADPHVQVATDEDVTRKKGSGAVIKLPPYSVTLLTGT